MYSQVPQLLWMQVGWGTWLGDTVQSRVQNGTPDKSVSYICLVACFEPQSNIWISWFHSSLCLGSIHPHVCGHWPFSLYQWNAKAALDGLTTLVVTLVSVRQFFPRSAKLSRSLFQKLKKFPFLIKYCNFQFAAICQIDASEKPHYERHGASSFGSGK